MLSGYSLILFNTLTLSGATRRVSALQCNHPGKLSLSNQTTSGRTLHLTLCGSSLRLFRCESTQQKAKDGNFTVLNTAMHASQSTHLRCCVATTRTVVTERLLPRSICSRSDCYGQVIDLTTRYRRMR